MEKNFDKFLLIERMESISENKKSYNAKLHNVCFVKFL